MCEPIRKQVKSAHEGATGRDRKEMNVTPLGRDQCREEVKDTPLGREWWKVLKRAFIWDN